MEKSIKELITDIVYTKGNVDHTRYEANDFLRKGKKGDYQSKMVHLKYLNRKLDGLVSLLKKRTLDGHIIEIKFKIINDIEEIIYEARFANFTQEDVMVVIELLANLQNGKYEILESREIPTYIRRL